jgi:hypothetical protein
MNLEWSALRLTGTIVLFQRRSLPSYQEWAKCQYRVVLKNQNSFWLGMKEEIMAVEFVNKSSATKISNGKYHSPG